MKFYHIQIWFLDNDLEKSAEYLSDKYLEKTIEGCVQALLSARFYFYGIHNKKAYAYYFQKDKRDETMHKFFPYWSVKKLPVFKMYTSRISKWTRKCQEHYEFIKVYLDVLLKEYEFRHNKPSKFDFFLRWENTDAPKLNIPLGNLKNITLEWKSIDPKYRNKDIILSYKTKYKKIMINDGIEVGSYTKRAIPEFLL